MKKQQIETNKHEIEKKQDELSIEDLEQVSGGSNVSNTRSEISMTFARNSRA